ncbi:MAG: agmatine deiminase family protein [Deltaproteobacteria bacterium]|nr:agmatine deiminase family protein [Deltaproteobacteria bacterium]
MKPASLTQFFMFAVILSILAMRPGAARAGVDPSVVRAQEAALPAGVLPAWETTAEKAHRTPPVPRVTTVDEGLLPPPPASPYRVPAEFEPVAAFVVTQGDWGGDAAMLYDMIKKGTAAEGAGAIVLTWGTVAGYESTLQQQGVDLSRVHVLKPPRGLDAKWARDFGPISLYEGGVDGELAFVDMHYYNDRTRDDAVTAFLAEQIGVDRYGLEGNDHSPPDAAKLYLEGGNFQTDGQGACILSDDIASDNAGKGNTSADTQAKVEGVMAAYLGCQKFIWLTPMPNNSTGHVDMYAKLLTPTDILMIDFPNTTGPNGQADAVVEDNVAIMEAATNLAGDPFVVHRVTIPSLGAMWVYKTYTNSVILNKVVMVPTYNAQYDEAALDAYKDVLGPGYTVVGVPSGSIVAQGGAVHCTTMQIASACGNGRRDELLFEECDGNDLNAATCGSLGLGSGELACDAGTCRFDTSGCELGTDTGTDSETGADADADGDADGDVDAGVDGGAFDLSPGSGGCGCAAVGSPSVGLDLLAILAAAL